jgi:hypothetical protein
LAQLCQNLGISGGGELNPRNPPPRYATENSERETCRLVIVKCGVGMRRVRNGQVTGDEKVDCV